MPNALITARTRFSTRFPEQRTSVNNRQWGVLRAGETGPALLMLPGTLGRADIFWQQIDALKSKARILALSYPETGGIKEWSLDITALLAQHGLEAVTVLGSSLGGYVAQYFTATHPEIAIRLIAANTLADLGVLADSPPYNTNIDALASADLMTGFTAKLHDLKRAQPDRADLADLLLAEVEGRIPIAELRNRLKALQGGPVLPRQSLERRKIFTVESDDDQLIPAPVRQAVQDALNPARAYVFNNGTHFPYVTQPQKYTAMLTEILEL